MLDELKKLYDALDTHYDTLAATLAKLRSAHNPKPDQFFWPHLSTLVFINIVLNESSTIRFEAIDKCSETTGACRSVEA